MSCLNLYHSTRVRDVNLCQFNPKSGIDHMLAVVVPIGLARDAPWTELC